jgi:hypothetical protein
MATNIYKVITYGRAVQIFIDHELPDNWVDWMNRSGEISDWQAANWSVPDICNG